MNFAVTVKSVERNLNIAKVGWFVAMETARGDDPAGDVASGSGDGAGASSDKTSATERAALSGLTNNKVKRLHHLAERLERAAADLASEVVLHARERTRRLPDGRVVARCGNIHGCPTDGNATREDRCPPCWEFRNTHGWDRSLHDVEDQRERQRAANNRRKQAQRAREAAA